MNFIKNSTILILIVLSINSNAQNVGSTFEFEINLFDNGQPITCVDSIVFKFENDLITEFTTYGLLSSNDGVYKFKITPKVKKITKKGKLKYYYIYYTIIKSGYKRINEIPILLNKDTKRYISLEKIISYPIFLRKFPEYPGDIENLRRFIYDNFSIVDLENADKEVYEIIFDLKESGEINSIEFLNNSINTKLSKEILHALNGMPNWLPKIINGEPVPAKASIEIELPLTSEYKINYKR